MTTVGAWRPPYDFNAARPTFVDAWPRPWRALSPAHELVALSRPEMNALGWQIAGFQHWFAKSAPTPLLGLAARIDAALARVRRSGFVRLTSRSPKDSLYAQRKGLRVSDGAQALAVMTEGSRRCAADLRMALDCRATMAIVVREWMEFPPSAEIRCYMVGRRWVGSSQLGGSATGRHLLTETQARELVLAVQAAMREITAASPIPDAAFDLARMAKPRRSAADATAILLDVNPLLTVTDLGYFSSPGEFDATFRFHAPRPGAFAVVRHP